LRSDVRVGTCFSGGVDSSAIVYAINDILKKESISSIGKNQFLFSSVFKSDKKYAPFDESKWIELGAKDTGAVLVETEPTVEKLISDIQKLAWHQDEPFKTMSIFSSWCVMEQARKNGVTVTLDGQGPDETVGGYNDIFYVKLASDLANFNLPLFIKDLNGFYSNFGLSKKMLLKNSLSKFRISPQTLLKHSLALSAKVFEVPSEVPNVKTHRLENKNVNKQLKLLVEENLSVLLRYADRNSMAFSVESRMPWLDYRLVDYCFSLEQGVKVAQGWSKLVERKAIESFTNKEIAWRKSKLGFPAPQVYGSKKKNFRKFILTI
jgi:asparagine synthase (glutamine-hydrolysing)